MNTVYVVIETNYREANTLGVFSTRELADEFIVRFQEHQSAEGGRAPILVSSIQTAFGWHIGIEERPLNQGTLYSTLEVID